jgi:hypothetical protein
MFDEWLEYKRNVKRQPLKDRERLASIFLDKSESEIRAAIDTSRDGEYQGLIFRKQKANGLTRNIADQLKAKRHSQLNG